jgi:hypothetical protein
MKMHCCTAKSVVLASEDDNSDIKKEDIKIEIDEESWRNCLNEPLSVSPEVNAARTEGAVTTSGSFSLLVTENLHHTL